MIFGSVCSGIEAASVAWNPLGWKAAWFAEIEPFPSQLLQQRFPDVPNLGDMTKLPEMILNEEIEAPDLLCGGTPCQAFSVAGLRKSLDDERGNLSLVFCEIANAIEFVRRKKNLPPPIIFWENVPGVLNTKDNAFGCFVGALAGADFPFDIPSGRWESSGRIAGADRKLAWRTLDAQYFGVPQRRKRVFVVASSREGFDPSKVLFECPSVSGITAPSRGEKEDITAFTESSFAQYSQARVAAPIRQAGGTYGGGSETLIYDPTYRCDVIRTYKDIAPNLIARMGTGGNNIPLVVMDQGGSSINFEYDKVGTLRAQSHGHEPLVIHDPAYCIGENSIGRKLENGCNGKGWVKDVSYTLNATGVHGVSYDKTVRRLTPVECERLQGFPDNWTRISYKGKPEEKCPESHRYKAVGNSWAVPVVRWLGERIQKELSE